MDSSVGNSAFQEALQRARQLAAKIGQPGSNSGKRPNEDDDDFGPDMKRASYDEIGSTLSAMKNQNHNSNNKPQRNQVYVNGIVCNGEKTLDFMLPGSKVGFVIGKGGEMIRTLQDKAGVRMVIFQETSQASDQDKQLRITGPPEKVDYAKQLVQDLLLEKEMESSGRMGRRGGDRGHDDRRGGGDFSRMHGHNQSGLNEYGSSSRITFFEYPVSPQLIGLVIGKGGETIRKIQADSGCKVQFDTAKLDAQGNKICQFTGTQDAVNKAVDMVKEIIDTITGGGPGGMEEVRLAVPASRTGTVIGRGGETIRQLKQQSGCNIELDKNFHSDNDEKCFIIRGSADKIGYAQQLVTDKVGSQVTVLSSTMQQYNDNQYGYLTSQIYANQVRQGHSAPTPDQYGWPQGADASKQGTAQDQYTSAMWAAYYAQYAQYAQQPQAMNGAQIIPGQDQAQANGQYDENVYKQWIEYYKACGMPNEAEAMEKSLRDYKNSKNGDDSKTSKSGSNSNQNSHSNGDSHK